MTAASAWKITAIAHGAHARNRGATPRAAQKPASADQRLMAKRAAAVADNTAALVDEAGDLKKELDPFELKRTRYESIRKLLRARHSDAQAPEADITLEGKRFTLTLGPREHETEISISRAFSTLGKAKFLKACKMTLTALKAAVSPDVVASLCSQSRTGSRSIVIAEKGRRA